jgi:hypothetical protein
VVGFGGNGLDLGIVKIPAQNNLPTITFARNSVQVVSVRLPSAIRSVDFREL